jgi:hypothetical protein
MAMKIKIKMDEQNIFNKKQFFTETVLKRKYHIFLL